MVVFAVLCISLWCGIEESLSFRGRAAGGEGYDMYI